MCILMFMRNFKELINAQNIEIINTSFVGNVPGHIAYCIAIYNAVFINLNLNLHIVIFQGTELITLDLSNVTLTIVFILVLYYHLNYTLNCMLQKTWPRDHESVVDLSQNLFIGSSTKHEKIKNFNVYLIFSPHYFIYMKFQLLIYGKLRTYEELKFRIKSKIFYDYGAWRVLIFDAPTQ